MLKLIKLSKKLLKKSALGRWLLTPIYRGGVKLSKLIMYNKVYYFIPRGKKYQGLVDFFRDFPETSKLILMDIGARGDLPKNWSTYRDVVSILGFEPDEKECERLNNESQNNQSNNDIYYPYFIGDGNAAEFHITDFPPSAGLPRTNSDYLNRFYETARKNLAVVEEVSVKTVTIDSLIVSGKIPEPDFIKIDVEGFESQCLENAQVCFPKILGVFTEVILGPLKNSPETFSRIDQLCRKHGLHLYEVYKDHSRCPRRSFEKKFKFWRGIAIDLSQDFGQRLAIDCLYLRDPIYESHHGLNFFTWNDENVLKMLLIYESYHLHDCAIELLDFYSQNFVTSLPVSRLRNLLIPRESNPNFLDFTGYIKAVGYFEDHEKIFRSHRRLN